MNSKTSKVFHDLCGKSVIGHIQQTLNILDIIKETVIVVSQHIPIHKEYGSAYIVPQPNPIGTANAVEIGLEAWLKKTIDSKEAPPKEVLILCGDTPLISPQSLQKLCALEADIGLIKAYLPEEQKNAAYGRVIETPEGSPLYIKEYKDANQEEKNNRWMNAGFYKIKTEVLLKILPMIKNNNANGEYYLTSIVEIAVSLGFKAQSIDIPFEETLGINTRGDLENAYNILQQRLRRQHLENGVTFLNADSCHISYDTEIGQDTIIEPHVFIGTNVKIGKNAHIKSFSYLNDCVIKDEVSVGPFAHVRECSILEERSVIGNFVELKKTHLHQGAKAKHLSYLGDAIVGEGSNIGAGTITANYDGFQKYQTIIGARAHIGAHTTFVAPTLIGDEAMTAAGTVITDVVPANALAIGRPAMIIKEKWSEKYRNLKKALRESI